MSETAFSLRELGDDYMAFMHAGEEYKLAMISLAGRARLDSIMRQIVPDPIRVAREAVAGLPPESITPLMEKALYKRAFWPPAVESDEGIDYILKSNRLQVAVISEMLRRYHPAVAETVAGEILERIGLKEFGDFLNFAWMGVQPGEPLPKAPGAGA